MSFDVYYNIRFNPYLVKIEIHQVDKKDKSSLDKFFHLLLPLRESEYNKAPDDLKNKWSIIKNKIEHKKKKFIIYRFFFWLNGKKELIDRIDKKVNKIANFKSLNLNERSKNDKLTEITTNSLPVINQSLPLTELPTIKRSDERVISKVPINPPVPSSREKGNVERLVNGVLNCHFDPPAPKEPGNVERLVNGVLNCRFDPPAHKDPGSVERVVNGVLNCHFDPPPRKEKGKVERLIGGVLNCRYEPPAPKKQSGVGRIVNGILNCRF